MKNVARLSPCRGQTLLHRIRKQRAVSAVAFAGHHVQEKRPITRRALLKNAGKMVGVMLSGKMIFPAFAKEIDQEEDVFDLPGPFTPVRLPKLEHTCSNCFPLCVGDRCLIRIQVIYPKASRDHEIPSSYPLAILSGGFLVKGEDYESYAERLASWGYVAILYDKVETITESLDDVVSSSIVRDIIDWSQSNPLLQRISDTEAVYLIGHSRGGKVSVLTALMDSRVKALCLIDPVDNTVYAPVGPGYPSAVDGLKSQNLNLPIMIVGSELGSDCAPLDANFTNFYNAASGPVIEAVIEESGHFQFLDNQSNLAKAICLQGNGFHFLMGDPNVKRMTRVFVYGTGETEDQTVRRITQGLMISWGEATIKPSRLSPNDFSSTQMPSTHSVAMEAVAKDAFHLRDIEARNTGRNVRIRSKNLHYKL